MAKAGSAHLCSHVRPSIGAERAVCATVSDQGAASGGDMRGAVACTCHDVLVFTAILEVWLWLSTTAACRVYILLSSIAVNGWRFVTQS